VKAVAAEARLGALQFHGEEKPEDLLAYDLPVIKTIKLPPASTIEGLPEYRVSEGFQVLSFSKVAAAVLLDTAVAVERGRDPRASRMAPRRPHRSHLQDRPRPKVILSAGSPRRTWPRRWAMVKPYGGGRELRSPRRVPAPKDPDQGAALHGRRPVDLHMTSRAPAPPAWPDASGHFGRFGGRYVPETLMEPLVEAGEGIQGGHERRALPWSPARAPDDLRGPPHAPLFRRAAHQAIAEAPGST